MGLLSSNTGRQRIITSINKHGDKLGLVSYFAGFLWLALLAHEDFNAKRYISENQLLPGLVETHFSASSHIYQIMRNIQHECSKNDSLLVTKKIFSELEELNLDVFTQNFLIPSMGINGTNVFGIYRSPRASGAESIVLNIPFHDCSSAASVAMMIALARYFRQQSFWAKDIIFLVTEHNIYGVDAWLGGYFEDKHSDIIFEPLKGHGGSIQAALVFDLPSESFSYFDILIQGLNGMQPNLDLIHVIVRVANLEGVHVKLENQKDLYIHPNDYWRSLETLVKTIATQATGIPSGNHGMFYKYRIEAYTLKGFGPSPGRHGTDFESIGRLVEGIFRSVNNLLEHIHQSFFMYLLPNTNRYISIGLYMPPLACLLLPLLICLLKSWCAIFNLKYVEGEESKQTVIPLSVLFDHEICIRYCSSYAVCGLLYFLYTRKKEWFKIDEGMLLNEWSDLFSFTTTCLLTTVFLRALVGKHDRVHLIRLYCCLHLATVIVCGAIMNFPAALSMSTFYVPAVVLLTKEIRFHKILHLFICLLANPPVFVFILSALGDISLTSRNFDYDKILSSGIKSWNRNIKYFDEYCVIRLWTRNILFWLVLPLWLMVTVAGL